jgi:HlyD family secretion protein
MRRSWALDSVVLALVLGTWPVKLFRDAPDVRVTSEPVTRGQIPAPILATGTVRAAATMTVVPKLSGTVQTIEAMPHAIVHAGDILAHLDPGQYRAALTAAQIALADAQDDRRRRELALEDAESRRAVTADLAASALVAHTSLDPLELAVMQARAALMASEERVIAAQTAVDLAAAELQKTVITAPADGLILSIAQLGPTFTLATGIDRVRVDAPLDRDTAAVVRAGDPADISTGTLRVRGHVVAVDLGGGAAGVTIDVPARAADLQPGTRVSIALGGERRGTVVRVPNAALIFTPPRELLDAIGETRVPSVAFSARSDAPVAQVWTYDGCEFTAVRVRTGYRDASFTELIDGPLRPGDMLVTGAAMAAQ